METKLENRLIKMIKEGKYDYGLEISKKLPENTKLEKLDKYKYISAFYFQLNNYEKSLNFFDKILPFFDDENLVSNKNFEIQIYYMRVSCLVNLNKNKIALYESGRIKQLLNQFSLNEKDKNIYLKACILLDSRIFVNMKKYDKSIEKCNQVLSYDPNNIDAYFNIAISYYLKGDNKNSLNYLNKALKINNIDKIQVYNLLMTKGMIEVSEHRLSEATKSFEKAKKDVEINNFSSKQKLHTYKYLCVSLLGEKKFDDAMNILNCIKKVAEKYNIPENNFVQFNKGVILAKEIDTYESKIVSWIKCKKIINFLKIGEFEKNIDLQRIIYYKSLVFDAYLKVEKNKNNIDIITKELFGKSININKDQLINLIHLIKFVHEFIKNRKVNLNRIDSEYYQYTSSNILNSILDLNKINSNFRLRLYNASYMNDSKEGYKLLFDVNNSLKKYINNNNFYNNFIKNSNKINVDNIYLASLSMISPNNNEMSLPLWNNYGDNNRGLGLTFGIFNKNLESEGNVNINNISDNIEKNEIYHKNNDILKNNIYDLNHIYSSKVDTTLYRVVYSGSEDAENLINKLNEIFLGLNDCLSNDSIRIIVANYMDKIRYLYKNSIYSYEKEVRIIKQESNPNNLKFDAGNPKLYVNLENEDRLNIFLKSITFGVNFYKPFLWYPLIFKKLGTDFDIRKSSMDYR
ncbi:tetratricopeptide repeat protein [Apilactobacillus micheneri]|uniref:tetratricopeptide repeat protein n=1 Tax=Apilactobacillus micheneri TaxID=1899430 RepID=UPI0011282C18|nr:tetratricopeptide repeat protein [Apilactobacillus micheneri]TPR48163.1 tetratricopeptide repeat protein [Apilactobacillus micheneri]